MPFHSVSRMEQVFRLLFLRRLRLPLPLTVLTLAGVAVFLATTGGVWRGVGPSENAAARISREAGRVRTNVFVRDLDLAVFDIMDERRLEVVVDGLPLFRAQLAVDTTLVCHDMQRRTAQLWNKSGGAKSGVTPSLLAQKGEPDSSFLLDKWAVGFMDPCLLCKVMRDHMSSWCAR